MSWVCMSESASSDPLRSLYVDHHGWLQSWLQRKLGSSCEAADLAQDTFVRVIAGRRTHWGAEPRAFLTHVAKGLLIDHWRRREVERAYLEAIAHLPEPEHPSAEAQHLIVETLLQIERLLSRLPKQTREIFLLSQLDGLTQQQVAERLDTPLITVRRHLRKALIACLSVG